ncbi:MAG: hypothetical protein IH946_11400, partial [Bacteroidetes bacterium]|nr:hypothetical protein [Bacteroidota bacterium]
MKRLLLIAVILPSITLLHAQITLEASDFPQAGNTTIVYEVQSDSNSYIGDSISIGNAGADGTYDMSKLNAGVFQFDTITLNFQDPANTPFAADHPGATVSTTELDLDSATQDTMFLVWDYYRVTSEGWEQIGISALLDTSALFGDSVSGILDTAGATFMPADTIALTSWMLGFTGTYSNTWDISIGGRSHMESFSTEVEVDGWGSLSTPGGTFDVLRVRKIEIGTEVDSLNGQLL